MLRAQSGFIPITDFEREVYAKAAAKSKAEAVLAVLAARGLAVTADQRSRLLDCADVAKLDRLVTGAVSAPSVAGLLADL
jgi:hypothetical protein